MSGAARRALQRREKAREKARRENRGLLGKLIALFGGPYDGRLRNVRPTERVVSLAMQRYGKGSGRAARRRRHLRDLGTKNLLPNFAANPGSQAVHRARRDAARRVGGAP